MSVLPSQIDAILSQIRAFPFMERNYIIERILMEFEDDIDLIPKIKSVMFRITGEDITANTRKREVIIARFIAFHYLYHEEGMTLQEIGQVFGKHHTSVIHALHTVDIWREDRKFFNTENKIYDKLKYLMSNED